MPPSILTPSPDSPVLVIGSSGIDVIGRLEADLNSGSSNSARIRRSYGGVARNISENLARLGQPVRLLTVAGNDPTGDDMLEYTQAAGVDISAVLRTGNFPTGYYMGVLNNRGLLEYAVDDMRLMSELGSDTLRQHETFFKEAGMVVLDANLPNSTLRTAFSLARKAKVPVCADPASARLAHKLGRYLPKIFLTTPNSVEAGILTGKPFDASDRKAALDAARQLVSQGVNIVLITLAEFGVVYATSETNGHIPAIRTRITDPTGAGDALTAAVIFSLLNDIELDDAIRLGVAAASLTLRHTGTVYPGLSLEKLYDQLPT